MLEYFAIFVMGWAGLSALVLAKSLIDDVYVIDDDNIIPGADDEELEKPKREEEFEGWKIGQ